MKHKKDPKQFLLKQIYAHIFYIRTIVNKLDKEAKELNREDRKNRRFLLEILMTLYQSFDRIRSYEKHLANIIIDILKVDLEGNDDK